MLRASIRETGADYRLDGIAGAGAGGIPEGEALIAFAEAVVAGDGAELAEARRRVLDGLGPEALADAAGVAATFNAIDRVADATGTPLEQDRVEATIEMRGALGIDRFPSAAADPASPAG